MSDICEQIILPCGCAIRFYGKEAGKHKYGFTPCRPCRVAAKIRRLTDAVNETIGFLHYTIIHQAEPNLENMVALRTELEVALEGLGIESSRAHLAKKSIRDIRSIDDL